MMPNLVHTEESFSNRAYFFSAFVFYLVLALLVIGIGVHPDGFKEMANNGLLASVYIIPVIDIFLSFACFVIVSVYFDAFGWPKGTAKQAQKPSLALGTIELVLLLVAAAMVVYIISITGIAASAGLLFVLVTIILFGKNIGYVLLGKNQEEMRLRTGKIFGLGLTTIIIAAIVMFILSVLSIPVNMAIALLGMNANASSLSLMGMVILLPAIYYAVQAAENFLEYKELKKGKSTILAQTAGKAWLTRIYERLFR